MKQPTPIATLAFFLLLFLPSCISVRVTGDDRPSFRMSGLGTAYAGVSGIDKWDGNFIRLGLFRGTARSGEIFSFDIWPFGGVGIGVAGVRARVLPLEAGVGTLFYHPRLPERAKDEDDTDEPHQDQAGKKGKDEHQGEDRDKADQAKSDDEKGASSRKSDK